MSQDSNASMQHLMLEKKQTGGRFTIGVNSHGKSKFNVVRILEVNLDYSTVLILSGETCHIMHRAIVCLCFE